LTNPERWSEIDRVFAAALELPPSERAAFLDGACGDDSDLRRAVEGLLAADQKNASFLEHPAGELLAATLAEEEPREGERLGAYRLLRQIGSGGMGTVYLARRDDAQYQQQVAVKILRRGLESTEALHRFLAERQILARLEHPNIARLYDGGTTEDGRPFLVMELVDGLPVDQYCDRHKLSVDQRLDLFRRICGAVQYAHQNLLVHRDLKPGNILVTPEGEPKLLDFGIAKQLELGGPEAATLTRTGLRVMTPNYASPEQVKGEAITTASDVYSLGVLLYELLVGRSPYRATTDLPHEVERAICEQEPVRPSLADLSEEAAGARGTRPQALRRRLEGDLDNIVQKALRKDLPRRYGSVGQLARDVENYLQNLPVLARPDTLPYRARKFLRRHRVAAAVAAAVVVLVLGFVLRLIDQGRRLAQERDKARYALSFLIDTFKEADPYHTRGEKLTAEEVLAEGARRVSRDLARQPDVQAALMDAIGQVQLGLGKVEQAAPLLEGALALRRKHLDPEALEVAESLEHVADLKYQQSDFAASEKLFREAVARKRRLLGDQDLELAKTLNNLGIAVATREVSQDAEAIHQEALKIARAAEGAVGPTVAQSIFLLAKLEQQRGEYVKAESLFRQGLDVERRALGDQDPHLYRDQTQFAEVLLEAGKHQEAEEILRRTLKAQEKILSRSHPDFTTTLNNLAESVRRQGDYAEAEALNREVLAIVRSEYGPSHWMVGTVLANLASSVITQGRQVEAIGYLEEVIEIRRRSLGEGHPTVAQALLLIAGAHRELKQFPQALSPAKKALAILEKAQGPDHPHVSFAAREIGNIYKAQKRYREAEPYLRRALDIRRKELPPEHPDLARAKGSLADCYIGLGRYPEAEALLREAEAALSAPPPDHLRLKTIHDLQEKLRQRWSPPQTAAAGPATGQ